MGGWGRDRISLEFLAIGRAYGLTVRQVEALWERLSDDPRFHLAPDPERWRRAQFAREAAALGAPRRASGARPPVPGRWSPEASEIGKRTLVDDLPQGGGAAPRPSELPFRGELEEMFGTSFADVRAFTNQDSLLAPHRARAAAFRGGVAFAGTPSKALVAHELVHVRQLQTSGVTGDASAAEQQADAVAHAVARGARRVAVSYVPTSRVSFSPDDGPGQGGAITLTNVVVSAIQAAQADGCPFDVAFEGQRGLDAAIKAAAPNANVSAVHDGLVAAAKKIGAIRVKVRVAGGQTADVTLDDLLNLFAKIFLGPGLEQVGLPASFGNDLAIQPLAEEVSGALEDALNGATGAADATQAAARRIAQRQQMLEAAIEQVATTYKDPGQLVELELQGAVDKLRALRGELGSSGDPELGGKIAHLARYILMLSQRLGPIEQRLAQARKRNVMDAAPLSQLEAAGGELQAARKPIGSESDTLQALGNKSSLINVQQVATVDDHASMRKESIAPEEAFAKHTDQTMANAQSEIVGKSANQERELAAMKKALVPERIASRGEFSAVYARWFGFFSKVARDDSPTGSFLAAMEQVLPVMPLAGANGMMTMYGTQRLMATGVMVPGAGQDGFKGEVGKVGVTRSTSVGERADRGGESGVDYGFDENAGGKSGGDIGSRSRALGEAMTKRKAGFDDVYAGADAQDRQARAAKEGLGPKNDESLRLYDASDYKKGRDGANSDWNYLLPVTVMNAAGHLETVYEHKVMREEVARYLIAVSQHLATVGRKHELRDPNAPSQRLGDQAGRGGDVMASKADASATYGDPKDGSAAQSASARAQFAAQAARAPTVGSAIQSLDADLEGAMDRFFAGANASDRLLAIILDICVTEYELREAIWQQFTAEALWEFAKQAMKIAALFWALKHLGPVGEIISTSLHAAFKAQNDAQMEGLAVQLGGWLEGATACRSFNEARGWAWAFRSIAGTVAQTIRDWAANHAGGELAKGLGKGFEKMRGEPRTVGAMREELASVDKATRREMVEQLKARLVGALESKKPLTPEQQSYWAMLNAVDEAAANALRAKHGELPELDASSSLGASPTVSTKTPMSLAAKASEVRTQIDKHLANAQTIQPYRVEVIPESEFTSKFKSEKGRSAVTVVEDGHAVVYARESAPPSAIADEAIHLIQLNDPKSPRIRESIHMLGEASLDQWGKYDVETRKNLFERKLEVEIDAKHRRLDDLAPGSAEHKAVVDQLKDLENFQKKVQGIKPEDLQAMKASGQEPDFLKDPAWLFEKKASTAGVDPRSPGVDMSKVARTPVTNSPAAKLKGVKRVEQVGQPWKETTTVYASNTGKVVYDPKKPGELTVGGRRYVFEDGAQVHVKNGATVSDGDLLVTEPAEEFRIVEVTDEAGQTKDRLEYNSKKRGGWVQAGEHSTKQGDRVERAGRAQISEELDKELAQAKTAKAGSDPNRLDSYVRVAHQNSRGQGFDDVIIEFRGDPPTAKIRIIEIKDYPRRYLQLSEMSAIRETLATNMEALRGRLTAAVTARTAAGRPQELQNLGKPEIAALNDALRRNAFEVEIHVGPDTLVGDEGRKNSMLSQLRTELQTSGQFGSKVGVKGKDVLASDTTQITQDSVNKAPETDPTKPTSATK